MNRNKPLLLLYLFLKYSYVMVVPGLAAFWAEGGLTLVGMATVQAIYCIVSVFIEVATSKYSDNRSRKLLLIVGPVALAASCLIYLSANGMAMFLLAEIFCGFGFACISGVDEAIVYETLSDLNQQTNFQRWWEQLQSIALLGAVCSFFGSGFLIYLFGSSGPFYAGAGCYLLATLVGCFLVDSTTVHAAGGNAATLREAVRFVISAPAKLLTLIFVCGGFTALVLLPVWWYQPALLEIGVSQIGVGVFFGSLKLCTVFTPRLFGIAGRHLQPLALYGILSVAVAMALFIGISGWLSWTWILLGIPQLVLGGHEVAYAGAYQSLLPDRLRATITSFREAVARGLEAILIIPLYFFAMEHGIQQGFILLGLTMLGLGLTGILVSKMGRTPSPPQVCSTHPPNVTLPL